jgi:hypothetical protein
MLPTDSDAFDDENDNEDAAEYQAADASGARLFVSELASSVDDERLLLVPNQQRQRLALRARARAPLMLREEALMRLPVHYLCFPQRALLPAAFKIMPPPRHRRAGLRAVRRHRGGARRAARPRLRRICRAGRRRFRPGKNAGPPPRRAAAPRRIGK